ncbi:MAG TPA: T9SS type A sorting domain-containing protein [Flavisolibacter sp.]|nr:T9SS type A sorting domain-containing protein [Flavisolibacter sp.]
MRRILLPSVLSFVSFLILSSTAAQNDRFAYAITDVTKDGTSWNALRRLDLQTGEYSDVMFIGNDLRTIAFDASSKKQLAPLNDAKYGNLLQAPFSTGVAAAAYDRKHDRLYYTPMFIDQLRYIDLKTMKVYYIMDKAFTKNGHMNNEEGKVITRMAITSDGTGYAISNDGNTMIRFSTGKKIEIEQMGSLSDDPSNKGISIHNRCSSYGGDMIADNEGNLYVFSAMNNVFKVNTSTRIATHLGQIKNLPQGFTVNGAVVDLDNNILVSSAVSGGSYYVINYKDWSATPYITAKNVFKSSDLANSNVLCIGPRPVTIPPVPDQVFARQISLYPNPVTENRITLEFNKVPAGDYLLEVRDLFGRTVQQSQFNINAESQTQQIALKQRNTKGVYFLKISDRSNKSVFSQKIIVR